MRVASFLFLFVPFFAIGSAPADHHSGTGSATQNDGSRIRFLNDRAPEDFVPRIDGPRANFRNDAHDMQIHISHTRSTIDPHHGGPDIDSLMVDIDIGERTVRWPIIDRQLQIENYRISTLVTGPSGTLATIVQRQAAKGQILTSVLVLHTQMDEQETKLPAYSGEMWDLVGADLDGDGTIELAVPDQRFFDSFGPGGHVSPPPVLFALQHGRYVDASRDGSYLEHFRGLELTAAQSCDNTDGLMKPPVRAACLATVTGLMARSGNWPAARHLLKEWNNEFFDNPLPSRDEGVSWNEALAGLMIEWGYIPADQSVRWWNASWDDFYGNQQSGAVPFEVQLLVYDLQGCVHFSNQHAEKPGAMLSESIVAMQENHCLRPDKSGEFNNVNDIWQEWVEGKYRDDEVARNTLEGVVRERSSN